MSAMWGASDAIWQTMINGICWNFCQNMQVYTFQLKSCILHLSAFYGTLFSEEPDAAFCNYRLWESVGFIIAFAYSSFLCTSVKLYILISMLIVGFLGYLVVEYKTSLRTKAAEKSKVASWHDKVFPRNKGKSNPKRTRCFGKQWLKPKLADIMRVLFVLHSAGQI